MYLRWDKVFKNGPSEIYGAYPLNSLKRYGLLKQLLEILLGPFMNTLSHMFVMLFFTMMTALRSLIVLCCILYFLYFRSKLVIYEKSINFCLQIRLKTLSRLWKTGTIRNLSRIKFRIKMVLNREETQLRLYKQR